jgi:hypothetical protein
VSAQRRQGGAGAKWREVPAENYQATKGPHPVIALEFAHTPGEILRVNQAHELGKDVLALIHGDSLLSCQIGKVRSNSNRSRRKPLQTIVK